MQLITVAFTALTAGTSPL